MEAISGRMTIQEIAADHPIQVSQWKRQLLDGASELFIRGKKSKDKGEGQAKEAELFQEIGKLQIELDGSKKISAALMPVNCASWSITTTPRSASAANVRCRAYPVTVRKDDAPAAGEAAMANVAGFRSSSGGGGVIQTTSG